MISRLIIMIYFIISSYLNLLLNTKPLALAVTLVLVTSVFVYPAQYADADDFIIKEECTSEGWLVTTTDSEGNPLNNVRIMTLKKISSSSPEESFFTDDKGKSLIPFSSLAGFVSISKGGYNDQKLSISCNPPAGYTGIIETGFLRYTDPLFGIKIEYPPDWQIDTSNPDFRFVLIAPEEISGTTPYQESVIVLANHVEFDNPTDYASAAIPLIKSNLLQFELIENVHTTLGGHPAQKLVYSGTSQFGVRTTNMIYLTIVDGVGYAILYDSASTTYHNYLLIFEKMIESIEIDPMVGSEKNQDGILELTPIMPQMINGKYINSEARMEIEFPNELTGFEITFPKDIDYSELPAELQGMAEMYSGMTMVMMLPAELDPTENIEMMMLTIMETSSIETFSEFISQTVESGASQSSGDADFGIESQPECDISNQTILEINEMKSVKIDSECYDPTENMTVTMSIYMFMTPQHVISPMYIIVQETDKQSDLSIFENSLNTLNIENTIDISDPNSYAELFGLKITQENIVIENKSHEIDIVSDSTISNFSFDETNYTISFESEGDPTLSSTEIYLGNALMEPFTVTIDGSVDDTFMVTKDNTTGQTSIGISYFHPVEKISIKGNKVNVLLDTPIPDWIRNNASWWVEGNIDDDAFVGGIQFLIKEGIIQIPETTQSTTPSGSQEIPTWVKNSADWWSQGLISDDDFLKGITFLVENGIITV